MCRAPPRPATIKRTCNACWQWKAKCDLAQPCGPCVSSGRECIYSVPPDTGTNPANDGDSEYDELSDDAEDAMYTNSNAVSRRYTLEGPSHVICNIVGPTNSESVSDTIPARSYATTVPNERWIRFYNDVLVIRDPGNVVYFGPMKFDLSYQTPAVLPFLRNLPKPSPSQLESYRTCLPFLLNDLKRQFDHFSSGPIRDLSMASTSSAFANLDLRWKTCSRCSCLPSVWCAVRTDEGGQEICKGVS